nr:hypothetical protein [Bacteroidota bacterium]
MEERIDLMIYLFFYGIIPAAVILIIHFRHKMLHKEKLAMIEKGLDISTMTKNDNPLNQILMWGTLLTGIGFGLLFGYLLSLVSDLDQNMIVPIMAILFGGIGLIVFYIFKKKTEKKESR